MRAAENLGGFKHHQRSDRDEAWRAGGAGGGAGGGGLAWRLSHWVDPFAFWVFGFLGWYFRRPRQKATP